MTIRLLSIVLLTFLTNRVASQTKEIESRTIGYYFEQIADLETKEMLKQGILIDSITIKEVYKDATKNQLNKEGFLKYADIKMEIYLSFFKDHLYMQKVEYKNDLYVLYFTMAGFDDMEWNIFKWNKKDWTNEGRLSREMSEEGGSITKILWNYDEGPKNTENIRIFTQNDYLVMERGNLYHSLFDLKTEQVVLNEESPWAAADGEGKDGMNKWIKINLHDNIEKLLNEERK